MLRLAAIEFLNAAPLMFGLEADPRFTLTYTLPAACADALAGGRADLGVIPVIELARIPGLVGLGGVGVASQAGGEGEVRSILLVCRGSAAQVRTLALDPASRTSSALAQVLLRHWFGATSFRVAPGAAAWRQNLSPWPARNQRSTGSGRWGSQAGASSRPAWASRRRRARGRLRSGTPAAGGLGPAPNDEGVDAVLVIGDPALQLRVGGDAEAAGLQVYDLAREWRQFTGLPFVFALWGIRQPAFASHPWLPQRLAEALEEGLREREALVAAWAPRLGLAPAEVHRYLTENVAYRLEAQHLEGLQRFFDLAAADGLIASPQLPELSEPTPATVQT